MLFHPDRLPVSALNYVERELLSWWPQAILLAFGIQRAGSLRYTDLPVRRWLEWVDGKPWHHLAANGLAQLIWTRLNHAGQQLPGPWGNPSSSKSLLMTSRLQVNTMDGYVLRNTTAQYLVRTAGVSFEDAVPLSRASDEECGRLALLNGQPAFHDLWSPLPHPRVGLDARVATTLPAPAYNPAVDKLPSKVRIFTPQQNRPPRLLQVDPPKLSFRRNSQSVWDALLVTAWQNDWRIPRLMANAAKKNLQLGALARIPLAWRFDKRPARAWVAEELPALSQRLWKCVAPEDFIDVYLWLNRTAIKSTRNRSVRAYAATAKREDRRATNAATAAFLTQRMDRRRQLDGNRSAWHKVKP